MRQINILQIVVSWPDDVEGERNLLPDVIDEINKGVAADRDLRLEIVDWKTSSHPGFHPEGPGGLIGSLLRIEDCDILIGIFWKQLGAAGSDPGSGPEREFRVAYETWKNKKRPQIMIYFNQKAYSPRLEEIDEWQRVLRFKEGFPKEGFYWTYRNRNQFKDAVRSHLTSFIRDNFVIESKRVKQRFPVEIPERSAQGTGGIDVWKGFPTGPRSEWTESTVASRVPEATDEERGQGVSGPSLRRDLLTAIAKLDESMEIVMRGSDLIIRKLRPTVAEAP